MSSNIKVKRICQHCSKEFTARTTVTKYCSHKCSQRAYKARKRAEKVKQSNAESTRIINQPIEQLKAKEFLSIKEVCQLVGISRRTVYRLIENGNLNKIKIGSRTLIKRSALNRLLSNKETGKSEIPEQQINDPKNWKQTRAFDIKDCYTLTEVQDKYKVSESTVQQLIKRNRIPKIKKGWYAYVPKHIIDELLT
ncbi:helix-turn-helix domain-containing protein [Maribacter thermophilus]|uniref:helix-turn-helix domain-containing protein n=1 Tax=Maribacter thermophilus TaxID=1197874 RepID=UPI000640BA12|nr:helix-turn-helix domain-containing protein [Maribacter thermophilus]